MQKENNNIAIYKILNNYIHNIDDDTKMNDDWNLIRRNLNNVRILSNQEIKVDFDSSSLIPIGLHRYCVVNVFSYFSFATCDLSCYTKIAKKKQQISTVTTLTT